MIYKEFQNKKELTLQIKNVYCVSGKYWQRMIKSKISKAKNPLKHTAQKVKLPHQEREKYPDSLRHHHNVIRCKEITSVI